MAQNSPQTLPFTPLVGIGPEDSENQDQSLSFLDMPQAKVNVAMDATVRDYLSNIWDTIRRIKSRRSTLEEEWLAIQRMTVLEHDEGKKYNGRSNAYLPVYARARKTLTSALSNGLFPSDEYMDVADRENGESEEAKCVKDVIQYEFETSANIRAVIKPFLGQFVDFGFAVMKRWYRMNKVVKPKRKKMSAQALAAGVIPDMAVSYDEGFTLSNRSVFNVVVYPEWAESKRDLQLEAERMDIPTSYVRAMDVSKKWLNVQEALSTGPGNDNFDWQNQTTLYDVASISNVTEFRNKEGDSVSSVIAVEAWFSMVMPAAQYSPEEDKTLPIPVKVTFINGVPVECRRNPFYDGQSPFEYGRDNLITGSFYGNGAGRLTRSLQYLSNDFANQINDVGIYGLNPVTLINTNYFAGAAQALAPGRVFRVRDVEQAMKFVSPKVEIVQYGLPMLQQTITAAQDGSGAPPVLQGSKAASTATGSQLLSQNAQSPLQDTVEDLEAQVMIPLMKAAWSLAQQYRNKPFLRKMLGKPPTDETGAPMMGPNGMPMPPQPEPVSILPSDINIDCEFKFLSSSQTANRQARAQALMTFTQLLQPLLPILNSQGKTVDPTPILQKAWTDGLGNRNFDKVIIPMPPPPMPPGGPMGGPPGAPPQAPPNPNELSAVGQGNVMPPEQVNPGQGEGDTLGPIRQETDFANGQAGLQNLPVSGR